MKHNFFRMISLALVLTLAFGLVACGGNASSASGDDSTGGDSTAFNYSANLTDGGHWKGVAALDYVTLPQYQGVDIPADKITATEEAIEGQKTQLLENFATYEELTDRAVEDADAVNIDYVGSVDGVEFTGGNTNGAGTLVTIGVTNYIDDFLTQLIGHKPGETFDVVVTFPEDYNDSTDADGNTLELKNKEAVFSTTVNFIQGDKIYPELTDTFVAENLTADYAWKTVEEMHNAIVENLENNNKYIHMSDMLLSDSTITEVPEVILNSLVDMEVANGEASAAQWGLDLETYMQAMGYETLEDFKAALAENVADTAKQMLIFQAIAETEKLEISDSDVLAAFGGSTEQYIAVYGQGYVKMQLMAQKVADLLVTGN